MAFLGIKFGFEKKLADVAAMEPKLRAAGYGRLAVDGLRDASEKLGYLSRQPAAYQKTEEAGMALKALAADTDVPQLVRAEAKAAAELVSNGEGALVQRVGWIRQNLTTTEAVRPLLNDAADLVEETIASRLPG